MSISPGLSVNGIYQVLNELCLTDIILNKSSASFIMTKLFYWCISTAELNMMKPWCPTYYSFSLCFQLYGAISLAPSDWSNKEKSVGSLDPGQPGCRQQDPVLAVLNRGGGGGYSIEYVLCNMHKVSLCNNMSWFIWSAPMNYFVGIFMASLVYLNSLPSAWPVAYQKDC